MNKSESKYFNTALRMDEALIALLEKKDLEYITVKEICEKAGVNRSTFYLHYESIADLVNEAMERMPGIGYVGWDIAVTPDGCELIEGNCHWPGGNIIQLDGIGKYPQIQKCLEGAAEEDGKEEKHIIG